MSDIKPKLDDRGIEEILREISLLANFYTPNEWQFSLDINNNDLGSALSKIFADMYMKLLNRFNKIPEKNFIEFLNMCNFYLNSQTPSMVPVTFKIPDTLDQGVFIPAGKKISAKSENGEGELVFETCNDILVTNSEISNLYSTVNEKDIIYDHKSDMLEKRNYYLFKNTNENKQKHILYLGHDSLFNFELEATINIEFVLSEKTIDDKKTYLIQIFRCMSVWEYNWILDKDGNETSISRFSLDGVTEKVTEEANSILVTLSKNKSSFVQENKEGKISMSEINGIQSHWIRCRLLEYNGSDGDICKDLPGFIDSRNIPFIDNIKVSVQPYTKVHPDDLFYNSFRLKPVKIEAQDDNLFILPFGSRPSTFDTFYIGSNDVFSKRYAKVTLEFGFLSLGVINRSFYPQGAPKNFSQPFLSWEYWDGTGWNNLSVNDGYTFNCPDNISQTSVNGYSNFWIRLRILSGDYGKPTYIPVNNTDPAHWDYDAIYYPIIKNDSIVIKFNYDDSNLVNLSNNLYIITYNNLQFENHFTKINDKGEDININSFKPFISMHEYDLFPSVYLGFNKKLKEGPYNLYLSLIEYQSYYNIDQNLDIYYSTKDGWKNLESFIDDTKYLMKRGWMKLYFPDDFEQLKLFDNNSLFWLKMIDSSREFDNSRREPNISKINYPHFKGIYFNTIQARSSSKITDEILIYNDSDNSFSFSKYPLSQQDENSKEEIWINERKDLIENQLKEELNKEYFYLNKLGRVRVLKDALGKSHEIWVKWEEKKDISVSGPRDRHFELDRIHGKLYFGDGVKGMSPPRRTNIVKATYYVGGGNRDNVAINQVVNAKDFIPFLESINNPEPSYGGYNTQTQNNAQKYWPELIKTRYQFVSYVDFESLISNKFTSVFSAKCFPTTNENGLKESGHITIVVVPLHEKSHEDGIFQPFYPSIQLLEDIKGYVQKYSSNLVLNLSENSQNLHIIGPVYIKTSVSLTLFLNLSLAEEGSRIKKESYDLLNNFLNPFTGGFSGNGWSLGSMVSEEEITSLFGNIREIEGVGDIEITYEVDKKFIDLSLNLIVHSSFEPNCASGGDKNKNNLPFNSIIYSSFDHRLIFKYES